MLAIIMALMIEDAEKDPVATAGGIARAASLSPDQRREIAQKGATRRWLGHAKPVRATHAGTIKLGDLELACANLPDGRRVVSEAAMMAALGRGYSGYYSQRDAAARDAAADPSTAVMPRFLSPAVLKPYLSDELRNLQPIPYIAPNGTRSKGVDAEAVPQICEVWLKAREAGKLVGAQLKTASKAELIVRGLARVGIIALVDEATGYQYHRARHALAEILETFIRKELAVWASTFPPDYYEELFRLRNLKYDEVSTKRPPLVGKDTRDIVYKRLAPGVLKELERLNPRTSGGVRKAKHFQWLTPDVGHPKLKEHLVKVTTLMKASTNWAEFRRMLDRVMPKQDLPLLVWAESKKKSAEISDDATD
jgi:hypothetical protein